MNRGTKEGTIEENYSVKNLIEGIKSKILI